LRESLEKYGRLINQAPEGIYEVDIPSGKFISVNDVMCEYTGYSREEILSMTASDLLAEQSKQEFMERTHKLFAGEEIPETVEYKAKAKDGAEFWVILKTKLIYENGIPSRAAVVVHDITQIKEAQQAFRKEKEMFQVLVYKSPLGISVIDKDGNYKYLNR
jgi:PAS domain S-box-containing protein